MADEDFLTPDFGDLVAPKSEPRRLVPFEILTPNSQKDQADFRPHISRVIEQDEDFAPKSSSVPEFAPSSAPPLPPETDESPEIPAPVEKDSTASPETGDLPF